MIRTDDDARIEEARPIGVLRHDRTYESDCDDEDGDPWTVRPRAPH